MELIKEFMYKNSEYKINIQGTLECPLFYEQQIGKLLEIDDVENITQYFDTTEKAQEMLTDSGIYRLIEMSNKHIATAFQQWVSRIIRDIYKEGKTELEKKLEEKTVELSQLKKRNNKKKFEIGDRIYVYEDTTNDGSLVYKIGHSKNLSNRVVSYDTTRFENKLKFELPCDNGKLLVSVVHHKLRKMRDNEKSVWFRTDLSHIIDIINMAKIFLDDFVSEPNENSTYIMYNMNMLMNSSIEDELADPYLPCVPTIIA